MPRTALRADGLMGGVWERALALSGTKQHISQCLPSISTWITLSQPIGQSSGFTTQWVTHFPLHVHEQMHPHTSVYTHWWHFRMNLQRAEHLPHGMLLLLGNYFYSLQIKEQQKPRQMIPSQSFWWVNELTGGYLQFKGLLTETGTTCLTDTASKSLPFPETVNCLHNLGMAWWVFPSFHKGILLYLFLWVSSVSEHSCSNSRWQWSYSAWGKQLCNTLYLLPALKFFLSPLLQCPPSLGGDDTNVWLFSPT